MPAWDLLGPALSNSFKLALVAFVLCVPLSILGGVIAGAPLRARPTDRSITIAGHLVRRDAGLRHRRSSSSSSSAIWLGWLPVTAQWDDGAEPPDAGQVPPPARADAHARALRVHRPHHPRRDDRGARPRLRAHGVPQGASAPRVVVRQHVLRNALLPDDRRRRRPGRLPRSAGSSPSSTSSTTTGIGAADPRRRRRRRTSRCSSSGVLVIGIVYLVVTLVADILYAVLNPRIRLGGSRVSEPRRRPAPSTGPVRRAASARPARSERLRLLLRSPTVVLGVDRDRLLGLLRDLRRARRAVRPDLRQRVPAEPSRRPGATRSGPTRTGATSSRACSRARASVLTIAPAGDAARGRARHDARAHHGLLRAASSTTSSSRFVDAVLALPLIVIAILIVTARRQVERRVGHRADHRTDLHAGRLADRARGRARRGASSTTCRRRGSAASARRTSCSPRSSRTSWRPIVVEFTVRLGYAIFAVATLAFLGFGVAAAVARLGGADQPVLDAHRPVLVDDVLPRARDREPRRLR